MKTAKEILDDYIDSKDDKKFERLLKNIGDYRLQKPIVSGQVCDHIREADGLKCTSGRCSKCGEIV